MLKIIIADEQYLTLKGLAASFETKKEFQVCGYTQHFYDLEPLIKIHEPEVLVIDYTGKDFGIDNLNKISRKFPKLKILAITNIVEKAQVLKAMQMGINAYVLKICCADEIFDATKAAANSERFFCSSVLDIVLDELKTPNTLSDKERSCEALKISEREIEIIQLVAEGLSNKEIADKLNLSLHTINTHRKNIMAKIGVKNTAGLVVFAIKEGIIEQNHFLFAN